MAFHVPLPASKSAFEKSFDLTDRTFCRLYCKDSIGKFLGLPLANPRLILSDTTGTVIDTPQLGSKIIKAVPDRVSARPYTLLLQPGTTIRASTYTWFGADGAPGITTTNYQAKTIQIFLPSYMKVEMILDWLQNQVATYRVGDERSAPLPGITFENYHKIIALTTPSQRTYPLESALYEDRVPTATRGVLDNPQEAKPADGGT